MAPSRPAGFFCEDNGNKSMGRLMSFMCVMTAIGLSWYGVRKPPAEASTSVQLALVFLAAGIGGKVAQKFAEKPGDLP